MLMREETKNLVARKNPAQRIMLWGAEVQTIVMKETLKRVSVSLPPDQGLQLARLFHEHYYLVQEEMLENPLTIPKWVYGEQE